MLNVTNKNFISKILNNSDHNFMVQTLCLGIIAFTFIFSLNAGASFVLEAHSKIEKQCFESMDWRSIVKISSIDLDRPPQETGTQVDEIYSCLNKNIELNKSEFSKEYLISKFKKIKELCSVKVNVKMPHEIEFKKEDQLSADVLVPVIKSELLNQARIDSVHDFTIKIVHVSHLNLSCQALDFEQKSESNSDKLIFESKNFARLKLKNGSGLVSLGVEFQILKNVPVAKRNLYIGDRISSEDWQLSLKDVTFKNDVLINPETFEGRAVGRSISTGQFITTQDLKKEFLVEKSQMVKVKMSGQDFEITTQGIAEASGYLGEYIKLKNPESQKIFAGTIIGKGLVEVK